MNILAIKGQEGPRGIAQLWMMKKLEYATLIVNQYPLYTVKICLTIDNYATLCMMLKKWENLGKNWDFFSIEIVVNILTKPDRV